MNHSDLKTTEFAAYIGLDWADQKPLNWAGKLGSLPAVDFLTQWPQLETIQRASSAEAQDFYCQHGFRLGDKIQTRLNEIKAARSLTTDQAVIAAF